MKKLQKHFKSDYNSIVKDSAIVQGDHYRFTVLTSQLIRMEYSIKGEFEDRPTQSVVNRDFPLVNFRVIDEESRLEIITEHLHIYYNKGEFSKNNLYIDVNGQFSCHGSRWYYGEKCNTLGGTCSTLDGIDGETLLEDGILSKEGFAYFDDSKSLILLEDGWVEPRSNDINDKYFFGYGRDYFECIKDFYKLCGNTPLLPRYTLGNWWSRYWKYTETTLKNLMTRFKDEKVPFSVCVIDMDWHVVDIEPKYGSGWTGYTWNEDFFPDPERMLNWLHDENYKVTLNLHPASGVRAHETMYEPMAKKLEIDYKNEDPISFNIADPKFMEAYFKYLHHPLEKQGVHFWWIDWQQGGVTAVEAIDPLWMLNHYHYKDINRGESNSIIFSRYAGIGSHRYPIGFSGDTIVSWESYGFQPYFTSTASNIGFCWWSHDIGGHMLGSKDGELTARWMQFGVFSPINRLHSSSSPFMSKEPWNYNMEEEKTIKEHLRLRHKLVPYIYTMNYKLAYEGIPFIRPMYYEYPLIEESYNFKNQYFFGSELMVNTITEKINSKTKLAKTKVWLPEGKWIDFFTGKVYDGDRKLVMYRGIENQVVLAKAGAIIPMNRDSIIENPEKLDIVVFPGKDNSFSLYEDDGKKDESRATTRISASFKQENKIIIHKVTGNLNCIPENRSVRVILRGVKDITNIKVKTEESEVLYKLNYSDESKSLIITLENYSKELNYTINIIDKDIMESNEDYKEKIFKILNDAEMLYMLKEQVYNECCIKQNKLSLLASLNTYDLDEDILGAITEMLL